MINRTHSETIKEDARKQYKINPEPKRRTTRKQYRINPESKKRAARKQYNNHPGRNKAAARVRRALNRDSVCAQKRAKYALHVCEFIEIIRINCLHYSFLYIM